MAKNSKYNFQKIEKKWQKYWDKNKTFAVKTGVGKKFYALVEFPYPSGAGLHVGHPRSFTAMDIICRKRRMQGENVLYPMGYDAFGLPTENYAIKTGRAPKDVTAENVANFERQLKSLGFSFDWDRVVNTTDPEYYKWTQWIFLQFFKHGLAYKKEATINWCPKDKIGLANEEVVNGCCERCGGRVEKRNKSQWMLAITKYADKLLEGLENVDYIEQAKTQQKNWIGKSEGAEVKFQIANSKLQFNIFTTRPDTLFGATYCVIAPEHSLVQDLKNDIKNWKEVEKYIKQASLKSDMERAELQKEKTGVELMGVKAINPANGEEIAIWVADYVLSTYGTGAIMAVPAHDARDFEFAKKFNLPIREVVAGGDVENEAYLGEGAATNSDFLNGLPTKVAKEKMINWLEEKGIGKKEINYKLRDWVFSRQRYWGEPIPLVYCEHCAKQKQKVLLIHGFEANGESNWFPWMKQELEKNGFEVFAPTLSDSDHPNLQKWLDELAPFIAQMGEKDIIIGHSLGSKAALHLVETAGKKIGSLILVASAIGEIDKRDWEGLQAKWPNSDMESLQKFWQAKFSWEKIASLVNSKSLILSDDDPFIKTATHEGLPREWYFWKTSGFGHYQEKEIPELLEFVLARKNTGWIALPESELPLELPNVVKYEPTDDGESPLSAIENWVNTKCPHCGNSARRETDTMPNWAGSSWYFLRYLDNKNSEALASDKSLEYWMPVDWYNGGMEHTTLHLLYSRFWNIFLHDIGVVPVSEPYQKRTSHGMILASDGEKMSKSRGNVVNPDEMVEKFGADALRCYIMFMGPFDQAVSWDTNGLVGVKRFLDKVWNLFDNISEESNEKIERLMHQTIKKVGEDIEEMRFHTAIAKMMELVNEINKIGQVSKANYAMIIKILSPFAPHMCEELWEKLGGETSIISESWPEFRSELLKEEKIMVAIQVNGKVRDEMEVPAEIGEEEVKKMALEREKIKKWIEDKTPAKVIYVKGRLISIAV